MRNTLKTIGVALMVSAIPVGLSAQAFNEGDNVLGLGVGLVGGYGIGFTGSGVTQTPAIFASFDHGMGELGPGTWGLGGYLGYKKVGYESRSFYYNIDYSYSFLVVGARGTWHYNEWHGSDKLDTYGGLMLGYRAVSYTDNTDYSRYGNLNTYSYSGSGLGLGGFLGVRYQFTDQVGAMAELGYGIAVLQLGVAFKF